MNQPAEYISMVESLETYRYSLETVQNLTKNDAVLSSLSAFVKFGWPKNDGSCSEYSHVKNDLSLHDGVVLFRNRIIVPSVMRPKVLEMLHSSHNGMVAMKAEARQNLWWPNISADIEEKVRSCNQCTMNNCKPLQPKLVWPGPGKTWSRLHIDYCGPIENHYFLIIVDAHSKFIDIHSCSSMTSRGTIECLRKSFANFGIPDCIVSDNAAYFVSEEIRSFYARNNISLKNSVPFHPASNGLAERGVRTFKEGMRKFSSGSLNTRLCRFLYNYRRTIHSGTKQSPDEIMFNRKFKSLLDVKSSLGGEKDHEFLPSGPDRYQVGISVFAKNYGRGEAWLPGVIEEVKGKRNFLIKVFGKQGDMIWRRHSDQLKPRYNDKVIPSSDNNNNVPESDTPEAIPVPLLHSPEVLPASVSPASLMEQPAIAPAEPEAHEPQVFEPVVPSQDPGSPVCKDSGSTKSKRTSVSPKLSQETVTKSPQARVSRYGRPIKVPQKYL